MPLAHQLVIIEQFSGNQETLLYPSLKTPKSHPKLVASLFSKNQPAFAVSSCGSKDLEETVNGDLLL